MKLHIATKETLTVEDTIQFKDGQDLNQLVESAIDMTMRVFSTVEEAASEIGTDVENITYVVKPDGYSATLSIKAELAEPEGHLEEEEEEEVSDPETKLSDFEAKLRAFAADLAKLEAEVED